MSMAGKMSIAIETIDIRPSTATSSDITTNVYGRRSARRTIHIPPPASPRFRGVRFLAGGHTLLAFRIAALLRVAFSFAAVRLVADRRALNPHVLQDVSIAVTPEDDFGPGRHLARLWVLCLEEHRRSSPRQFENLRIVVVRPD